MKFFKKRPLEFDQVITRGGDRGSSFLYDGKQLSKSDIIFESLGDLDELNSHLGIVRNIVDDFKKIESIQNSILRISSQVATDESHDNYKLINLISEDDIIVLEKNSHALLTAVDIESKFILPGEKKEHTAYIDLSRSVCRRCERSLIEVIEIKSKRNLYLCQKYLNRLSDFLFILARYEDL